MIFENLTIGTRIDLLEGEYDVNKAIQLTKTSLAKQLSEKLNSTELDLLRRSQFTAPRPRHQFIKSVAQYRTKQEKVQLSEMMMKIREDEIAPSQFEDCKKSRKILESLLAFEDLALAEELVDREKLLLLRRMNREILGSCIKSEEVFKFTHLESIVASITMTAASLMELSIKKVFSILELMFGKKLKLSKIRKSKGYELMKKVKIRVWDVY